MHRYHNSKIFFLKRIFANLRWFFPKLCQINTIFGYFFQKALQNPRKLCWRDFAIKERGKIQKGFDIFQVRGILNKLTPEKFEKLINDILGVGLDSSTVLKGVIVLVSFMLKLLFFSTSSLTPSWLGQLVYWAPRSGAHYNMSTHSKAISLGSIMWLLELT